MTWHVVIMQQARDDAEEAAKWFEIRSSGLGIRFIDEIDHLESLIAFHPLLFPRIGPKHRDVRRALLSSFPYKIFFLIEGSTITIFAILHAARRPYSWHKRLPEN